MPVAVASALATDSELDVVPVSEECEPPSVIAPARLLAAWPSLVGRRISVNAVAVERAVDFTEFVVVSSGVRFVVLMAPDQQWTGRLRRTFTVIGSVRVPLHGRIVLPQLLLEDEGTCAS